MLAGMDEPVGDRLRKARTANGLTQDELAADIGVTRGAISAVETGHSGSLNAENLTAAARRLGVAPAWLSEGKGPEIDPAALGEALAALPAEGRAQAFDYLLYVVEKYLGAGAVAYIAIIKRFRESLPGSDKP